MQNIDYSRRLRQSTVRTPVRENADFNRTIQTVQHDKKSGSPIQIFSSTRSAFILLLGSVSLFTAGLVVGLKLDQKEETFARNELQTFRNVPTGERKNENGGLRSLFFPAKETEESLKNQESLLRLNPKEDSSGTSGDSKILYPPRLGETNYLVVIATSDSLQAVELGKRLLMAKNEFKGRIFRSSKGELYLGYFYSEEKAQEALEKIQPLNNPAFHSAKIRSLKL
ncbi:hypothetical protein [Leptospira borgpetersenii]|uniref:SPOR domain-containing protein n=2 Tax=Leptospira borgpetersenii serovar Hardjo-bovis TaxID=338217 RepID=Q04PH1_LEPBJ|nr:hypothetical protein [Leptospira borgpetersenii]ABJ77199.1 Hypothetical protein LBJ_2792 [Leptospira borgpetersenii serovar Hardjo-bovis str. JB197]ABJ77891.1 Hypothetical protein LBL_0279 [Leptospira borgpetersenii serovar Hardjo-bovis str. L550]AMX57120.1 hypothetical protein LBK6_01520 [Leptospira borgpetersenii serovar Hardjo]AMX60351.1 hypothetical protein LBK9_01520 [Leptospira borgpetersenii serovar Hardjo]AMX63598.1 hypothetical protein LBK30_01535 [Leptospira borgpetersenii serovar